MLGGSAMSAHSKHHDSGDSGRDKIDQTANRLLEVIQAISTSPADRQKLLTDAHICVAMAKGDFDQAVNIYIDRFMLGSMSSTPAAATAAAAKRPCPAAHIERPSKTTVVPAKILVGEFPLGAYSSTKGVNKLPVDSVVSIDRQIPPQASASGRRRGFGRGGSGVGRSSSFNTIVRFRLNGFEMGRIPQQTAAWMSTLLDLRICEFTATVISAPDVLHTGDDVILNVQAYLTRLAFSDADAGDQSKRQKVKEGMSLGRQPGDQHDPMDEEASAYAVNESRRQALTQLLEACCLMPTERSRQSSGDDAPAENGEAVSEGEASVVDLLNDQAATCKQLPEAEAGTGLLYELRPYQKQALWWMMQRESQTEEEDDKVSPVPEEQQDDEMPLHPAFLEYPLPAGTSAAAETWQHIYFNPSDGELRAFCPPPPPSIFGSTECRGGVLADEMGLGKTIEVLALIHTHFPFNAGTARPGMIGEPAVRPQVPATLIVCPLSLISQWHDECTQGSRDQRIQVITYYGAERNGAALGLGSHGGAGLAQSLVRLCNQARRSHASSDADPASSTKSIVVITSYGTLQSEYQKVRDELIEKTAAGHNSSIMTAAEQSSLIYGVEWERVVLDEAHHIKSPAALTTRACYALHAASRWAVTGTPVQNKLDDLYSLLRFLQYAPWCRYSVWKSKVTGPIDSRKRDQQLSAVHTVQQIMDHVLLRRTKDMKDTNGQSIVQLQSKTINIEYLEFTEKERDIYDSLYKHSRSKYRHFVATGTVLQHFTHIFALLTRLRQTCDHPLLVASAADRSSASEPKTDMPSELNNLLAQFVAEATPSSSPSSFTTQVLQSLINTQSAGTDPDAENEECPLCLEPRSAPCLLPCMHTFCYDCIFAYLARQEQLGQATECPVCRLKVTEADLMQVVRETGVNDSASPAGAGDDDDEELSALPPTPTVSIRAASTRSSTKVEALLRHLRVIRTESPSTKSVVFSQFLGMLDEIQRCLEREQIGYCRLDGSMSHTQRQRCLDEFKRLSGKTVLLTSLKCGNVGLNLVCASRCFLMDPWWNFAVENQAIDRIHRIGQTQDVIVTRLIMKDSVEERMLAIQERKRALISVVGALDDGLSSKEEAKQQRLEDLRTLFG